MDLSPTQAFIILLVGDKNKPIKRKAHLQAMIYFLSKNTKLEVLDWE